MRLYWLNSRVGRKTKGLTPWFKAPVPGAPVRYNGWVWDPAIREWVSTLVEQIEIMVEVPKYPLPFSPPRPSQEINVEGWYWNGRAGDWEEVPMPFETIAVGEPRPPMPVGPPSRTQPAQVLGWRYNFEFGVWEPVGMPVELVEVEKDRPPKPEYPPGPAVPDDVEGWSWSETTDQWVATIVVGQKIGFTPPRSFPPMVDLAAVQMVYPVAEQYALFQKSLLDMGLTQSEARRIGSAMVDGFWNMSRSTATKIRAAEYAESFTIVSRAQNDLFEKVGVYGAVIAITVIVGLLIGSILERLTFPEDEFWPQFEPAGTYLMGPDNWVYSRFIGRSAEGQPYYSVCEGIGTEFVRHKRGVSKGDEDIIDFPGGFLETGYAFPWFVKFVWRFWTLEYIGMLEPIGGDWYVLKKGNSDPYARGRLGVVLPRTQWCEDFHWYL